MGWLFGGIIARWDALTSASDDRTVNLLTLSARLTGGVPGQTFHGVPQYLD